MAACSCTQLAVLLPLPAAFAPLLACEGKHTLHPLPTSLRNRWVKVDRVVVFFSPVREPRSHGCLACPADLALRRLFGQALELVQDSKATIFLVLELARGGELFDRIKVR